MAKPSYTTIETLFPNESVAIDPNAFDLAIQSHGVRMVHYRAMKCPVGLKDPDDVRRAHEHHEAGCSNGYIYRQAGVAQVLFTGNSNESRMGDPGLMDGSSVRVTFPRFYEDGRQIHVVYADRFFLADLVCEVPDWHTFRAHEMGIDRLQFPATKIEHVIDSSGREYDASLFTIEQGNLKWLTHDRPIAGSVCTVWYLYQPYWYCSRVINEVRVVAVKDPIDGSRMERMLYSAILTRENIFRNESNDSQPPTPSSKPPSGAPGSPAHFRPADSPRKQAGPSDGGFGER